MLPLLGSTQSVALIFISIKKHITNGATELKIIITRARAHAVKVLMKT